MSSRSLAQRELLDKPRAARIPGTSIILVEWGTGAIASVSAATICSSVTSPSRRAVSRVAGTASAGDENGLFRQRIRVDINGHWVTACRKSRMIRALSNGVAAYEVDARAIPLH